MDKMVVLNSERWEEFREAISTYSVSVRAFFNEVKEITLEDSEFARKIADSIEKRKAARYQATVARVRGEK